MNDDDRLLNNNTEKKPWRLSEIGIIKRHKWIPCCCCVFTGIILVLLSAQALFLPHLIDQIMKNTFEDALIFTYPESGSSYQTWLSNTGSSGVPIWMEMRFFNITNKEGVLKGEIPQLRLTNPIVYNEYQVKSNVNFSDDGEWVEFDTWTYYTFNKERSKLNRSSKIIVFSPLLEAVLHAYEKHTSDLDDIGLRYVLKDFNEHPELLFIEKTAEEVLFEFVDYHKTIHIPIIGDYTYNLTTGGLLNNKSTPSEVLHTGYNDHSRQGEVKKYSGSEYVSCWKVAIELSPGHDNYFGLWTIKKGSDETLLAWVNDLFVNLIVDYNGTENYYGYELYKYTVQIIPQFLNATQWPPNEIYYAHGPSGVLNLTSCEEGIPFFVSLPFFLGGPDYEANLTAMNLSHISWDDQPFLSVDPITGVIFHANKSLQMNTWIRPIPDEYMKTDDIENDVSNLRRILAGLSKAEIIDNDGNQRIVKLNANSSNETTTTLSPNTTTVTTSTSTPINTTIAPLNTTSISTTTTTAPLNTTSAPVSTTESPTSAPTITLANIPHMLVPIIETSECEGLTKSQMNDLKNEIDGANNMINGLTIVGYIAWPLLLFYTWAVCYWCGKRRANIKQ